MIYIETLKQITLKNVIHKPKDQPCVRVVSCPDQLQIRSLRCCSLWTRKKKVHNIQNIFIIPKALILRHMYSTKN